MLYMVSIKIYVYTETLERLGKVHIKLLRGTLLGKMKGRLEWGKYVLSDTLIFFTMIMYYQGMVGINT